MESVYEKEAAMNIFFITYLINSVKAQNRKSNKCNSSMCRATDREYKDSSFAKHRSSNKTDNEACNTDEWWVEVIPPADFPRHRAGRQSLSPWHQPTWGTEQSSHTSWGFTSDSTQNRLFQRCHSHLIFAMVLKKLNPTQQNQTKWKPSELW